MSVADYRKYVFPSLTKISRTIAALAQVETEIAAAFRPVTEMTPQPAELPLFDEQGDHAGLELAPCPEGGCVHLVITGPTGKPIDACLSQNMAAELGFYLTRLGAGAEFKDLIGRH